MNRINHNISETVYGSLLPAPISELFYVESHPITSPLAISHESQFFHQPNPSDKNVCLLLPKNLCHPIPPRHRSFSTISWLLCDINLVSTDILGQDILYIPVYSVFPSNLQHDHCCRDFEKLIICSDSGCSFISDSASLSMHKSQRYSSASDSSISLAWDYANDESQLLASLISLNSTIAWMYRRCRRKVLHNRGAPAVVFVEDGASHVHFWSIHRASRKWGSGRPAWST